MHEVALCYRSLAEAQFEMAKEKLQREMLAKRQATIGADLPKGRPLPALKTPEVAANAVPAQPAEATTKEKDQAVIAAGAAKTPAIGARGAVAARRGQAAARGG